MWFLCVFCVVFILFGQGCRIGEASHPGPGVYGLSLHDPDGGAFHELDSFLEDSAAGWQPEGLPPWEFSPAAADGLAPAASLQESPGFIASKKFSGPRPGMAFKMGPSGLGYYADRGVHLCLDELVPRLNHAVAALVLELDLFIPDPIHFCTCGTSDVAMGHTPGCGAAAALGGGGARSGPGGRGSGHSWAVTALGGGGPGGGGRGFWGFGNRC